MVRPMRASLVFVGAVFLASGCGGGGGSGDDDGGPGADAAGTSVVVEVWADAAVAPDLAVMVADDAGAFVRTVTTDAEGVATIDGFPAGGSVTVPTDAYGRPVIGSITTITAVQPGDHLIIGRSPFGRPPDTAGTLTVTFAGPQAGADQYQVRAGCSQEAAGSATDSVFVSLREVCVADGEVDVLSYVVDLDGARIAYAAETDVGIATASVPLPPWQEDLATWNVDAAGAPGDMGVEGFVHGYRSGIAIDEAADPGGDIASGGAQSFSWKLAPDLFDDAAAGVHARYGDGTVDRAPVATVVSRIADPPGGGASATFDVDLATDLFPAVDAVAVTDATPLGIEYSAGGTLECMGEAADATIWVVVGSSPPAAVGATVVTTWLVLSPGDLASGAQLPELDPDLAAELWPSAAFTSSDAGIIWIADTTVDYAAIRGSAASFAADQYAPNAAGTRCLLRAGRFGASARP